MLVPTWVRFTRLNTLKNSVRNCRFAPSPPMNHGIFRFLITEKSVLAKPGPWKVLRPRLPSTRPGDGNTLPQRAVPPQAKIPVRSVSYTHLRAHETPEH